MQVALRERDLDTVLLELFKNSIIQVTFQYPGSVRVFGCPDSQVKIESAVTEFFKQHITGRVVQHALGFFGHLQQKFLDVLGFFIIGNTDREIQPDRPVIETPVDHLGIDKIRVGYNDTDIIIRDDRGGARGNRHNISRNIIHLDPVTNFNGALEENDQTTDKIVGDILQTQADTDTQCANQDAERAEINPRSLEDDDQPDNDQHVPGNRSDRVPDAIVDIIPRKESPDEDLFQFGREIDQYNKRQYNIDDRTQREFRVTYFKELLAPD